MDAWSDFIRGWLEASNPWRAAFTDGSNELEVRTLCMFVFFITLHVTMMFLKKRGLLGDVLASRPTFVANNCHCCVVAPLAVYLLWKNYYKEGKTVEDYELWQQVGIPITLAYFMGDVVWYCIPAKLSPLSTAPSWDFLILFHHITMLACHYPTGSLAGATLCGAGDPLWSIELSCLGYLCEVSNPLMNYRWWLMQTLQKHRIDFSVTVVLLVASFVARVALLFLLIFIYILPMFGKFMAEKQVFIYIVCVAGHAVIMVLSMYWLKVLTRGGLSRMLTYVPPAKKSRGSFTFGTDMGRSPKAVDKTK
jgi:hypothetical protein